MEENFSLGGLRKKIDLSQLKGGLKAEQFDFGKKNKLESVFKKIDADGDGTITADEMSNYIDLLQDAAGADKKLNRKEAKAAGLGNRRHINKFLKQAIELSQNIKTPQEPSVEPEVTTPDVPVEDTPIEDTVVEEPPISIDGDEGDDDSVEQEEFTAADALKNLFGDKRKASVKIDGSATGLGRAYQGEIRLPNGETIEDGAFPENLRMTLPPEYGSNATMKLKLIDPENGIYETSAKDRNFQIVTDENGNVTIQSVNIEELQGKLNANLAEYARIEAERRAAEEAAQAGGAEGAGDVGDGNGVQQLTPEQIAAEKEKQRNAAGVADELYNALKGSHFNAVSGKAFQNSLNKVTSENASAILSQYNTKHPDESLVRMICNEKTSNDETRKEALNHIMTQLAAEAKAKGVPSEEVDALVTEFTTSADKEFDGWLNVIDATVMDNTMKRLLGLTQGATLNAGEISVADAQESVTVGAEGEYNTAKQSYDTAREEEGWFARRGDDLLGIFGCTTRADMEAKLGKYKGDIEKLQNCQTEDEFKAAYKEVFGIEYDGKKIAAYQAAYSDYVVAYGAKENADKMQTLFNEARGLNYDAYKTKVMEAMNMSADEVDALVDGMSEEYMAQNPHSDKKDVLRHWVDMQKQNSIQQFDQIAKGRTLEQINQDVDSVRQAAFGTNDIVNDVIKYNSNQELTGMATEIGAEIAVTTALALVPGGQAFAAARIAASAAKWGARGVKLARYMPKAANLVSKASSAVRNSKVVRTATNATTRAANAVKDSKLARNVSNAAGKIKDATPAGVRTSAGRIARSSDAAFEGTLAVNLVDGKSVEDSLKKALQNAAFAGAGATSAELAPFVAKALGCSSKVATEICEQSLDLASTAGISYGVSGGYTSDDALIDVITGVAMNRIGKIKGRKPNAPETPAQAPAPAIASGEPQPVRISRGVKGEVNNHRDVIADGEVARNINQQHLNANQRKMVEDALEDVPTPQELEAYAREIAYKAPTPEEQAALNAHQAQVVKDYKNAHELGNNIAQAGQLKPKSTPVPKETIDKLNDEIKGLNGNIKRLEQQIAGAKRFGKKTTTLEQQLDRLKATRDGKMEELNNLQKPEVPEVESENVNANYVDPHHIELSAAPESVLSKQVGDIDFETARRNMPPETKPVEPEVEIIRMEAPDPNVDPHHITVDGAQRAAQPEGATIDFETARASMPQQPKVTEPEVEIIRMEAPDPNVDPHHITVDGAPRATQPEGATIDFETARANMPKTKPDVNAELLQDGLFKHVEKLEPGKVNKFLYDENIETHGAVLQGNGTIAFEQKGVSYQLSYEDGKISALRLHDIDNTGNKTYYSYDANGNRSQISRDEFIEKFDSSNKKFDSTIEELNARHNSKYPLDNNGFVRKESYKDMSPDELVAEYRKLSEYEADGTITWSAPSPSGKRYSINNHDMSGNKYAIREALEERGLKLTRDWGDNQRIPEYGYKNIEIDPASVKATDEVIAEVFEDVATISRGINRASTSADIDALQKQISNLPDGKQKTQLQKQLDKKKQELNDNVVIAEAYEQPS